MRPFLVKQLDYDLAPVAGLALVGHHLNRLAPFFKQLDGALPVRNSVANSDILRSYLGLLVQGKSDFDAIEERLAVRQSRSKPLWKETHVWLQLERTRLPNGSGIAAAIDYSLNPWDALTENLRNGNIAVDNNHCENQIRPWALGRKAWLFAGSELAGQRAAVAMSLTQSAKLNEHDPWAYLKDVLERLPTHPNSRIDELLPHRWKPQS